MEKIQLNAALRTEIRKQVPHLRKQGKLPAVLYGHGLTTTHIKLDARDFERVFAKAGESTLIDLTIDDKAPVKVLIHDIQEDPVTSDVLHVDLYQVRMDEKIETDIPFNFIGESPAVKTAGGILVKNHSEVKIEALPGDLVPHIDVDISKLENINDVLKMKDLAMPNGIKPLLDMEEIVVAVSPPRSEAELKELEGTITEDVAAVGEAEEKKPAEEGAAEGATEQPTKEKEKEAS